MKSLKDNFHFSTVYEALVNIRFPKSSKVPSGLGWMPKLAIPMQRIVQVFANPILELAKNGLIFGEGPGA